MQAPQESNTGEPSQAAIFSALQSSSFRPKAVPSTVTAADIGELGPSGSKNARKIYCFRPECGSIILQKETAAVVDGVNSNVCSTMIAGASLTGNKLPLHDPASPFPAPSSTASVYWQVSDCPFAFDNIGFTRPDAAAAAKSDKPVKYLICAECDLGPLGWSYEGGSVAWLAMDRIRYGPE